MKRLLIVLLSICLISTVKCDIGDFFNKVGNTIKDVGNKVIDGLKKGANKLKEGIEIAGNKIVDCSKVVGLGVADVSLQAGKEVLENFKKGSEAVAFDSAEQTLSATKKTVSGVMDFASKILSDLAGNFKIECVRIFGTFDDIQLEFKAKVLNKAININEKFKAKNIDDLSDQIYKRILKEFGIPDIL